MDHATPGMNTVADKLFKVPTVIHADPREGEKKVYVGPRNIKKHCGVTLTVGDGTEVILFMYKVSSQAKARGGDSTSGSSTQSDNNGRGEKNTQTANSKEGGN